MLISGYSLGVILMLCIKIKIIILRGQNFVTSLLLYLVRIIITNDRRLP